MNLSPQRLRLPELPPTVITARACTPHGLKVEQNLWFLLLMVQPPVSRSPAEVAVIRLSAVMIRRLGSSLPFPYHSDIVSIQSGGWC